MKQIKIILSTIGMFLLAPIGIQVQAEGIPKIMEVNYESKLSNEPVLVQRITVPGVSVDVASDAVYRSAIGRKWKTDKLDNGDIQTKLTHRGYESTLIFKFKEPYIEVWSLSYKVDKKNLARKERKEPEGWIRNLHKDILSLLGLLPR